MSASAGHRGVMNPGAQRLASLYAESLLEHLSTAQANELHDELAQLTDLLGRTDGAAELLAARGQSRTKRVELIERLFVGRVSDELFRLLGVLAANDRLWLLAHLPRAIEAELDRTLGRVVLEVTSATPMDEPTRRELTDTLSRAIASPCVLHEHVDPDIIGGLVIRIGEKMYDASLAGQIERMAREIGRAKHDETTSHEPHEDNPDSD